MQPGAAGSNTPQQPFPGEASKGYSSGELQQEP